MFTQKKLGVMESLISSAERLETTRRARLKAHSHDSHHDPRPGEVTVRVVVGTTGRTWGYSIRLGRRCRWWGWGWIRLVVRGATVYDMVVRVGGGTSGLLSVPPTLKSPYLLQTAPIRATANHHTPPHHNTAHIPPHSPHLTTTPVYHKILATPHTPVTPHQPHCVPYQGGVRVHSRLLIEAGGEGVTSTAGGR